jgi:hypothetical protein
MATTSIFNYDLKVDPVAKVNSDQSNAIARDYLRGFFKQLEYAGIIGGAAIQALTQEDQESSKPNSKQGSLKQDSRVDSVVSFARAKP